MKTITLLAISITSILLTSCFDDDIEETGGNGGGTNLQGIVIDYEGLYRLQTDKNYILTNQIRYRSGKYVLDLSLKEALELGIDGKAYNDMVGKVKILNESGLKMREN